MMLPPAVLCLGLFAGMLVFLMGGLWLGQRFTQSAEGSAETSIIDGAVFALLGLLLGFAFAGAVNRLDNRRNLIIEEANAISTAYLAIDLLEPNDLRAVMKLFPLYLDARIAAYRMIDSGSDPHKAFEGAEQLQSQIWTGVGAAVVKPERQFAAQVVLPSITRMIEIATERKVALGTHLPGLVLSLLIGVALLSGLLAGHAMARSPGHAMARQGRRSLIHGGFFAAAVSLTIYTVLDIDDPRSGLVRLDAAERVLQDLRDTM
ncbi:MAG: hypothetical protein ABL956_10085 [Hyphomonadaceae bacterium]